MSSHKLPHDMLIAPWLISDPGAGGTFKLADKGWAQCAIKTSAAETRNVPSPVKVCQRLTVWLDTDGGDCTLNYTGPAGAATSILGDVGDTVTYEAITVGGALKWQIIESIGL